MAVQSENGELIKYNQELSITLQRSYKVVKANDIIQKARYDLSISELKALSFIFSKIKPADTQMQEYSFSIKEYCMVCGLDYRNGGNYAAIKKHLKGLRDKSFWLMDENGKETTVGWLEKVRIHRGSGKVEVRLDTDLQKYVLSLFENYTQYELLLTLPMRSAYSFRIYELLKSYAFQHRHEFDVAELKRMLAAEHYTNFKDFRVNVIDRSIKEINRYTDIEVSWEPSKKNGRKIERIMFYIDQRDSFGILKASNRALQQIDGQMSIFDGDKAISIHREGQSREGEHGKGNNAL